MVSNPILWIADEVGGERLSVENGIRSYGASLAEGAEVWSSVTLLELGWGLVDMAALTWASG